VKTLERSFPKLTSDLNPDVPAKYNHPLIIFINRFFQVAVFTYCGRSVDFVGSVGLVEPTVDPGCSVVVGGGVTVVQLSHMLSSPIALKLKGNRDIPLIRFNSRFESNHISQNEILRVVVDHSVEAVLMTVTSSVRRVS
jgi:hypothetical protein